MPQSGGSDRCPVIVNGHAGAMHAPAGAEQLRRMARDAGFEMDVIETHSKDDMTRELKRLVDAGAPKVGVAGGDGTVEIAIQVLAHTKTALGILSQGTFNNFATSLRLAHNLPAALKTLHEGKPKAVDLGKLNDRYFTESAGVGFFADGLALYGQGSNKNFLRGVYAGLRLALSFGPREITFTIDGKARTEHVTLLEVANTYRIAQAVPIAPEADVDDGMLDVVLIKDVKRRELLPYLRALRAQMHLGLPKVEVIRAHREVRIESRRRRNVHSDDQVGAFTPAVITVQPGALQVLVDDNL